MAHFIYAQNKDDKVILNAGTEEVNNPDVTCIDISKCETRNLLAFRKYLDKEINSRMDLSSVHQEQVDRLNANLENATLEQMGNLLRHVLDKKEVATEEVNRAKVQEESIKESIYLTLKNQGLNKVSIPGAVSLSITNREIYGVTEGGWDSLYQYIADQIKQAKENGQPISGAFAMLTKKLATTVVKDLAEQGETLPEGIEKKSVTVLNVRRTK